MPSFLDVEAKSTWKLALGELVKVPLHATLLELKRSAECALHDAYCIMEILVITELENMEEMEDEEVLFGVIESEDDEGEQMVACDICEPDWGCIPKQHVYRRNGFKIMIRMCGECSKLSAYVSLLKPCRWACIGFDGSFYV
ncbi:hypothetical protein Ddye_019790 [Dipteronia dyeriana]|uniref:PHD finger protein MALE STERILITY 1-like ubiquitin-like domain-containing protein n=1 Tax=Dipteronia dyeriana TaxID=168575 RepID=A0AAD9WWF1_9ROSI|nr:hypothetical protein Ddye_019790 [Dipteronia dyeriana]